MRACMTVVLLLLMASTAQAQAPDVDPVTGERSCFPGPKEYKVEVWFYKGPALKGRLLCMGRGRLVLATPQAVETFDLRDVSRIVRLADPIWDGAAKGAAVGLVMLAFCVPDCPGEFLARTTLAYAMYGLALDAIHTNRETLFRGGGAMSPRIAFRVRF